MQREGHSVRAITKTRLGGGGTQKTPTKNHANVKRKSARRQICNVEKEQINKEGYK